MITKLIKKLEKHRQLLSFSLVTIIGLTMNVMNVSASDISDNASNTKTVTLEIQPRASSSIKKQASPSSINAMVSSGYGESNYTMVDLRKNTSIPDNAVVQSIKVSAKKTSASSSNGTYNYYMHVANYDNGNFNNNWSSVLWKSGDIPVAGFTMEPVKDAWYVKFSCEYLGTTMAAATMNTIYLTITYSV